jgi:gluconolactonase
VTPPGITLDFTEGPAADLAGNVYFSDIPQSKIYRWDAETGTIGLVRAQTRGANGLMFDRSGTLIVAEMDGKRVSADDLRGHVATLADSHAGQPLHMANDLWIDAQNGIYFSDFIGPFGSDGEKVQVYYIAPSSNGGARTVSRATDDLVAPNGVIGSPDGRNLYVTDGATGKTWRYPVLAPGRLGPRALFAPVAADGMAVDANANIYLSGRGFSVWSPQGHRIADVSMDQQITNLTFGGVDRKTLLLTARGGIYTVRASIAGAPTPWENAVHAKDQAR